MNPTLEMSRDRVDREALAQDIRSAGRPVHINVLARTSVQARLKVEAEERCYAPGARYSQGETIRFDDQSVVVKAVQAVSNPEQGQFAVLTLVLPDGSERRMAADVAGASAQDREPVSSDERVRAILDEEGLATRTAVQEALGTDTRFVWFQDAQGDHWCLAEMLPDVTDEDLTKVWPLLQGLLEASIIHPRSTEELVKAIWGMENDGSYAYVLKAFALNAALQRCQEARWLGNGWVLEDQWQQLQERAVLVGPRQENVVEPPSGITVSAEDEIAAEEESEMGEPAEVVAEDFEAWRHNRRLNAPITLRASHYYGNWLPLTQDMRRIFPPLASESYGVTFYHQFGGTETPFPAWVDWSQGRILGSPMMYRAFYEHGVYPGARLVISHRGSLWDYDIQTKSVEGEQRLWVRRVFLADGGVLEYEEIEEPLRYQVDGAVFIAAARWEDLPALFRQAEEAVAGIFQLMYQRCCRWWEEGKRQPLYVTAQQLFEAIHYDNEGRLTSKATIAWELWRRLAFASVGEGRYLFRPEKGDQVGQVGAGRRRMGARRPPSGPQIKKDRSLKKTGRSAEVVRVPRNDRSPEVVERDWPGHGIDIGAYLADPLRPKVLFLRRIAHQRIRELLAVDRLESLTLEEFNRQVWQIGRLGYRGRSYRIDSDDAGEFLAGISIEELEKAHQSGELTTQGNLTWGSYSSVIGAQLNKPDDEMEGIVRRTLRHLLYGEGDVQLRMADVINQANGFGMNSVTGILGAVYPDEHVLYNKRSVDALQKLGDPDKEYASCYVPDYVAYSARCRVLRYEWGFESLTDVDWFMYNVGLGKFHGKPIRTDAELDSDVMYVLGLAAARGVESNEGFTIVLRRSTLEADVAGLGVSAVEDSIDVLERRLAKRLGDCVKIERGAGVTKITLAKVGTHHKLAAGLIAPSGSSQVPEYVFQLSDEHKTEFVRGFADAAGYVRRAQYYTDGRMFVFFQIRQTDWLLPTQMCRLLQMELGIPVTFIIWGHPNIRDPQAQARAGSWAKEHQLKVFCDAFEKVGFGLPYKQRAFEELVKINKELRKPIPSPCHPARKRVRKTKPIHPEERSDKLPRQLRGIHFDAWWQVCLEAGCPFADECSEQLSLSNQ